MLCSKDNNNNRSEKREKIALKKKREIKGKKRMIENNRQIEIEKERKNDSERVRKREFNSYFDILFINRNEIKLSYR